MVRYLINGHIRIVLNEYLIRCKVTEGSNKNTLVLLIPGGPGFGHLAIEDVCELIGYGRYRYILYDPLSCGESDKSKNNNDYNIDTYAEIACQVVEAVRKILDLEQVDLRIIGKSFGSMTAMYIPVKRPDWIINPSSIKLNQIVSVVGPISYRSITGAVEYTDRIYNDPDITNCVTRLVTGEIKDAQDYVDNVVFKMAPLYSDKANEMMKTWMGKFLDNDHVRAVKFIGILSTFFKTFETMYNTLTGCNIEVLNHFFKSRFNGFDLEKIIINNLSLYRSINILSISGSRDHVANPSTNSDILAEILPDNFTNVILDSKHSIVKDHPDKFARIVKLYLGGDNPS